MASLLLADRSRNTAAIAAAIEAVLRDNPNANLLEIEQAFRDSAAAAYLVATTERFEVGLGLMAMLAAVAKASAIHKGKDGCPKLDDLLHATINNAGNKGLSFAEAVRLLDGANAVGAALSCASAVPPKPAAVDDLVELLGTIDGMGLKKPEADGLFDKTREAAHAVVDGPSSKACQKLADLAAKIAADTGKKDKLTAAQGATLSAAAAAIRTELGC